MPLRVTLTWQWGHCPPVQFKKLTGKSSAAGAACLPAWVPAASSLTMP